MKLQELEDVLLATRLPLTGLSNRLRWGECESREAAESAMLQLAAFVTIKDDLHDHVSALKAIVQICAAVDKGLYLEECQRCSWGEHRCEYACTTEDDAHCEMFDDRPPHTAILDWLEAINPLRPLVKDWIAGQMEVQQGVRAALDQFFEGVTFMTPGVDDEGHEAMIEMSPEEFRTQRAPQDAKEDRANESVANRIDQYELNLERILVICQQLGDLQEVAHILIEGMPPQVTRPMTLS